MGKTKNTTKATNSALNNTPTNHPTSQGKGQPCASEKIRATTTPTPRTQVLAAGRAELISGDVPSVLTGATETQRPPDTLKNTPSFAMAGNKDALQLSGITPVNSEPPFAMAGNRRLAS